MTSNPFIRWRNLKALWKAVRGLPSMFKLAKALQAFDALGYVKEWPIEAYELADAVERHLGGREEYRRAARAGD